MKTNIPITMVYKVGVQRCVIWNWTPVFDQKKHNAFIVKESIDPDAHVAASLPVKNNFRFAYGGRQPCVGEGPHMASLAVDDTVGDSALLALARKTSCDLCGLSIPGNIVDQGRFEMQEIWSTKSGKIDPGCCYWLARTECKPSKYTAEFSKRYGNGQHLIVVLPDMAHCDIMTPFDEKSRLGWKINGVLPLISVEPVIESRQWKGTIEDGFLVGEL